MSVRKSAGEPVLGVKRSEPTRGKVRIFARLRWHRRSGTELTDPVRRRCYAQWATPRCRRRRSRRSRGAGGLSSLARCSWQSRRGADRDRRPRCLRAAPSARHLTPDLGLLSRRRRPRRAERSPLTLRVRSGVEFRISSARVRTGAAWASAAACAAPVRRCQGGKAGRDPVLRVGGKALAPDPGRSQRPRRSLPGSVPVPLHQRLGPDQDPRGGLAGGALALRARRLAAACPSRNRVG